MSTPKAQLEVTSDKFQTNASLALFMHVCASLTIGYEKEMPRLKKELRSSRHRGVLCVFIFE